MVKGRPPFPVGTALMAAAIMIAISLVVGANAKLAYASTTFTVNSTADPGTGGCDPAECTLREAINAANGAPGADTIDFNVSGPGCVDGVCTISPTSGLPIVTDPVIINGYTQGDGTPADPSDDARPNTLAVGDNAVLKLQLEGADAGNGLKIEANDSTVKGLIISNWENGVFLGVDSMGNTVRGNFIGTDPSGTADLDNNIGVALTNAQNSTIGGTTAAARNIISDNGAGISISGGTGNKVQGNYIGTDASGTTGLGNFQGIALSNAPKNIIGGTTAAARNIISGSGTWGIHITDPESTGNRVQGNFIGTDVTGTVTDPDSIPNNGDELGNLFNGVSIQRGASNNTIGGTTAAAGNVISGNGYNSGLDSTNTKSGVEVQFDLGDLPDNGVALGNRILSNSIYDNARLGIDLYHTNDAAGVTCNDLAPPPDNDTGPNNLQNFPEITSAKLTTRRIGGHRRKVTIIKGTLNSTPSSATTPQKFTLQFFGSPEADPPSGPAPCGPASFGEGKRFLDQNSVTTNTDGVATFTFITTKKVPRGQVVTATATNQSTGDTSEFSRAKTVS